MKLSHDEVLRLAMLARLGLTEQEQEILREQLSNILENMQILEEVDTTGISPTAQSTTLHNVVRNDEASPSWPRDEILMNAPQQEDGSFKVRAVLE